jgi:cysteine synthase
LKVHGALEIYNQCGGKVDMFVAVVPDGGTITGAQHLKEDPGIKVVG